jgi:hypothetical protein
MRPLPERIRGGGPVAATTPATTWTPPSSEAPRVSRKLVPIVSACRPVPPMRLESAGKPVLLARFGGTGAPGSVGGAGPVLLL